jgi:hypothetical protein
LISIIELTSLPASAFLIWSAITVVLRYTDCPTVPVWSSSDSTGDGLPSGRCSRTYRPLGA